MSDIFSALNPRDIGDRTADRMDAHQAEYEARFLESYNAQLARARRDGVIAPSAMTLGGAGADPRLVREGRDLIRNSPFVVALRDELRHRGRELRDDASRGELALAYGAYFAIDRRIDIGHTIRFGDDSIRLRGVIDGNGDRDRIEVRYKRPTSLGTLEVSSALRVGLDKPNRSSRVGLRRDCNPRPAVCGSIDLIQDEDANRGKVTSLTAHRIYKSGWMLTGGVERARAAGTHDTRVFVGVVYGGFL